MKISTKLFLTHSTIGLVALLIVSITFYLLLRNALIQRTIDQLTSINILKKDLVENYFNKSESDLRSLQSGSIITTIFRRATVKSKISDELSTNEIQSISKLLTDYGFKNAYLFDSELRQIFGTTKDDRHLVLQQNSRIQAARSRIHTIDASTFLQSKETLLFYYVPIIYEGKISGSFLIEDNFQKIQNILLEITGMGNTGESYIVAKDYSMRSSSRFYPNTPPLSIQVNTQASR